MAEKLRLSRNTIQARMARLEQTGVFLPYERAFSTAVLGYPLQAFISIGLRQTELPPDHRGARPGAGGRAGARLSGSIDLLALVACRDARHLFDTDARILSIDGGRADRDIARDGRGDPVPRGRSHGAGTARGRRNRLIAPAASAGVS